VVVKERFPRSMSSATFSSNGLSFSYNSSGRRDLFLRFDASPPRPNASAEV
jgi:hypothetical protein